MQDQWLFKSETYDNCNCAVNCGCQFNLPSTYGFCQSAFVGNIVEGHFNDTPLAGLNWAGLYKWPGEIAAGNGKRQIVIDERADEAQRIALKTIISGEACAPLSSFFLRLRFHMLGIRASLLQYSAAPEGGFVMELEAPVPCAPALPGAPAFHRSSAG